MRHLQPGMAAFGLAEGSLGSHVTAVAETLVTTVLFQSNIVLTATTSLERCALFALLVGLP